MISELTALIKKWRELSATHDARYVMPSGTVIRQCADDLEELVEANAPATTDDELRRARLHATNLRDDRSQLCATIRDIIYMMETSSLRAHFAATVEELKKRPCVAGALAEKSSPRTVKE